MEHEDINKETFSNEIKIAIDRLRSDYSFIYYDLHLSEKEKSALMNLQITKTDAYNNFGNLDSLESEVRSFLKTLDKRNDTSAQIVSQLITKLVKDILQGCEQETAWIAVRSSTPTTDYDLPRWHTDGYYFEPFEGNPYKFALTLKGPPTLFYKLPPQKKDAFYALQFKNARENNYNRQAIADLIGNSPDGDSTAKPNQGALFIIGSNIAAVHSEPPIHEERLFLSILPGTFVQIKDWESR